jgi:hypothetical protein
MTPPRLPYELVAAPPGSAADHLQKVQRAAEERAAERDRELESQASAIKEPRERIAIWERLHALQLPQAPGHVLVKVIAKQTRLTIGQVHEEQQRRAGGRGNLAGLGVHDLRVQQHDSKDNPHA